MPQWYRGDSRHTIAQAPQWHGATAPVKFRKCRPYIVLALSRDKQVFKEKNNYVVIEKIVEKNYQKYLFVS